MSSLRGTALVLVTLASSCLVLTIYDAILAGHPVVAWVTTDWSNQPRQRNWITDDGTTIGWYGPHEHAITSAPNSIHNFRN